MLPRERAPAYRESTSQRGFAFSHISHAFEFGSLPDLPETLGIVSGTKVRCQTGRDGGERLKGTYSAGRNGHNHIHGEASQPRELRGDIR